MREGKSVEDKTGAGMRGRISRFLNRRDSKPDEGRSEAREGGVSGKVFVLAGGGLRHMGRAGTRDEAGEFLGYGAEDLFWKDIFEVVHPEEVSRFRDLVSDVIRKPGASVSVKLRMLDAFGRWRWTEAAVQNVLETPDKSDGGLLAVNVRDLSLREA